MAKLVGSSPVITGAALALGIKSSLGAALSAYDTRSMQRATCGYGAEVHRASGTPLLAKRVLGIAVPWPVQLWAASGDEPAAAAPVLVSVVAIFNVGKGAAPPMAVPPLPNFYAGDFGHTLIITFTVVFVG